MLSRFERPTATCLPTAEAREVAQLMQARRVGLVVVVHGEGKPVGLVTDRDLAIRVLGEDRPGSTLVADVMTRSPVTVSRDASLETAIHTMQRAGVRRLPIVDMEGRVTGIVTTDDLFTLLSTEFSALSECLVDPVDSLELRT